MSLLVKIINLLDHLTLIIIELSYLNHLEVYLMFLKMIRNQQLKALVYYEAKVYLLINKKSQILSIHLLMFCIKLPLKMQLQARGYKRVKSYKLVTKLVMMMLEAQLTCMTAMTAILKQLTQHFNNCASRISTILSVAIKERQLFQQVVQKIPNLRFCNTVIAKSGQFSVVHFKRNRKSLHLTQTRLINLVT